MSSVIGVVDDDASMLRALALEHPERIDCLLLDVHLGGLGGFELQERLADAHMTTPIIFITALDDAPTRERAQRAGAVEYLPKPLDEASLIRAMQDALGPG